MKRITQHNTKVTGFVEFQLYLPRGRPKIHFVTDSGIWPLRGEGVYY